MIFKRLAICLAITLAVAGAAVPANAAEQTAAERAAVAAGFQLADARACPPTGSSLRVWEDVNCGGAFTGLAATPEGPCINWHYTWWNRAEAIAIPAGFYIRLWRYSGCTQQDFVELVGGSTGITINLGGSWSRSADAHSVFPCTPWCP